MLLVKTVIKPSPIEGLGVFAVEAIPKGTPTWVFDPRFDLLVDPKDVEHYPYIQQELVNHYAFVSRVSGKLVFSIDNTRFTNHSEQNNIDVLYTPGDQEVHSIANRDILAGEELLTNYRTFDASDAKSNEPYLYS